MSARSSRIINVAVTIAAPASVAAALSLLMVCHSTARAQGGGRRPAPAERRIERLNRQGELYDLDKSTRDMKGRPPRPADSKHAKEVTNQIRHDFKGLQDGYNAIVVAMSEAGGLERNHDSVFRAVEEIKKCSARLKTNLALPKPKEEGGEQPRAAAADAAEVKVENSLLLLSKHIYDFVTNPLFETMTVLDLEQGQKASRDLERIIELSERLAKKQ
ncbi:MAG TPA: hypothetical protein VER32_01555 [Pyrinomonadaceae bacterium]|nr:hypothetical protein [Pyrinomonadaceae bacterium]